MKRSKKGDKNHKKGKHRPAAAVGEPKRHKHADPERSQRLEEMQERMKLAEEESVPTNATTKVQKPSKATAKVSEGKKVGMTKAQLQAVKAEEAQKALKVKVEAPVPPPEQHGSESSSDESDEEASGGSEEDYSDTANEKQSEYRKGGYHRVQIGDVYANRYRVLYKLGWGYFSTVWLVWDYEEKRYQAMKVQKSAKQYNEAALDEIELLSQIRAAESEGSPQCAQLNDFFHHSGPNGNHVCMIFDVYGENLLTLIERYEYRGIPLPIVKSITQQVLLALDHIHSVRIIHTDLKPENVLLATPKHFFISLMRRYHPPPLHQDPSLSGKDLQSMTKSQRRRYFKKMAKRKESTGDEEHPKDPTGARDEDSDAKSERSLTDQEWEVERFHRVILADFGNSCWIDKQFATEVQTRQYRCPEVILGEPFSTPIDVWSLACMVFELITGDFLFNPQKGEGYSRDEDHLALISELLGELPESMRQGCGTNTKFFYNSDGQLRNISELQFWDLESLLKEKYHFKQHKAHSIAEFLLPMLECDPSRRATARSMLDKFKAFFEVDEDDYDPRERKAAEPHSSHSDDDSEPSEEEEEEEEEEERE